MEIKFKKEAIELFEYADQLLEERGQLLLCQASSVSDKWDTHRDCIYRNGPVFGMLREKDNHLLNFLRTEPDEEIISDVIRLLKGAKEKCDERARNFLAQYGKNIDESVITEYAEESPKLTKNNILEWTDAWNSYILSEVKPLPRNMRLMFLYIYLGYDYYREKRESQIEIDQPCIETLYTDFQDQNFRKYGLIPVDRERELILANPCRIYDKNLNKTIFLEVQPTIASVLDGLYSTKRIGELAFRGIDKKICPGRIITGYITEEIEYGLQFKLDVKTLPEVTKLYSKNYHDQLWVCVSSTDIQFEELCNEYKTQNESIVTQVVHLMYKYHGKNPVITHIDHEYIFYTIEEYERRLKDSTVKGKAQKRIKTFKVDAANIEMDYQCSAEIVQDNNIIIKTEVPFLYFILNAYFCHKDLLNEYFKEVLA